MTQPYRPILATLGYVFSPNGRRVLLIHRNSRPEDAHLGKYNGLGGKLEPLENIVSGMCREIREEAGIACRNVSLAGTISWPGFGKGGEDWFGFLFRIHRFDGRPYEQSPEGTLSWVDVEKVMDLPLWEGDKYFLPLILDPQQPSFHGVLPYRDGAPQFWSVALTGKSIPFDVPESPELLTDGW